MLWMDRPHGWRSLNIFRRVWSVSFNVRTSRSRVFPYFLARKARGGVSGWRGVWRGGGGGYTRKGGIFIILTLQCAIIVTAVYHRQLLLDEILGSSGGGGFGVHVKDSRELCCRGHPPTSPDTRARVDHIEVLRRG